MIVKEMWRIKGVKEHSDRLVVVNVEECGILIDVDTSEEFESVLATLERR